MAKTATLTQMGRSAIAHRRLTEQSDRVEADVDLLLWSSRLGTLRRFYNQPYWEHEAQLSDQAREIEGEMPLESVAEHSWKVADSAMILVDRFSDLDRSRCLELAIVHDKLELITGDYSPIDNDATGRSTHAFNEAVAKQKVRDEERALEIYLERLHPDQRRYQRDLYQEIIHMRSSEAGFVCGLDKLAALLYVIQKKSAGLVKRHYDFTLAYSRKSVDYFSGLKPYYEELAQRLALADH
jgi:putative hydrolase of HD superfamily